MYRRGLRSARDWINRHDHYRNKCVEIRRMFEANRDIEDPNQLNIVLKELERMLQEFEHPDPIIPPSRPGGTKHDRNIPPRNETMVPSDA